MLRPELMTSTELNIEFASVVSLIKDQSHRVPTRVALECNGSSVTYEKLEFLSNQLAFELQCRGVRHRDKVAVLVPSSIEAVVSVLGVLKAGATYIPISVDYPDKRIQEIAELAECDYVITSTREVSFESAKVVLHYNDIDFEKKNFPAEVEIDPEDIAYVLFTSGSTGQPKGVKTSHANLAYYTGWTKSFFERTVENKLPLTSDLHFAAAVSQVYSTLTAGATLHIVHKCLVEPARLFAWYESNPNFGLYCVPTVWAMALHWFEKNGIHTHAVPPKVLYLSGEDVSPDLVSKTRKLFPELTIWNLYGPTEGVANLSFKDITSESVSIGRPIPGTEFFVLDETGSEVAPNESGILYASGPGLSSGYVGRPDLTELAFSTFQKEGKSYRIYNTGDFVQKLPNGEFVFAGRKDQQVKINGQRIELKEIEHALQSHPSVEASVVVYENETLQCFLLSSHTRWEEVKTYLESRLPSAMVPERGTVLSEFPLLANGKIDRKQLTLSASSNETNTADASILYSDSEFEIIRIFESVLGSKGVRLDQNFFELGGNSLKAVKLLTEVESTWNKRLTFQSFFLHPTANGVLAALAELKDVSRNSVSNTSRPDQYPLRSAQRDLWLYQQINPTSAAYNITYAIGLNGSLNLEDLKLALLKVVRKEDAFSYTLSQAEGQPVWRRQRAESNLETEDVRLVSEADRESFVKQEITSIGARAFNLEEPLFRFKLFQTGENSYILGFVVHHMIFDGESLPLFCQALLREYNGVDDVRPLSLSASEPWIEAVHTSQSEDVHKIFWSTYLSGVKALPGIPKIYDLHELHSSEGGTITGEISAHLRKRLVEFCSAKGHTLNAYLMSVFALTLKQFSGQDSYLIASPFANRRGEAEQNAIGYLSNTLFVRAKVDASDSFKAVVSSVQNDIAAIMDHQQVPLNFLIETLRKEGVPVPASGFPLLFAYHLNTPYVGSTRELAVKAIELPNGFAKCDLHLECFDSTEDVQIKLTYSKKVVESGFAAQIVRMFIHLTEEALSKYELSMSNWKYLPFGQRDQIIPLTEGERVLTTSNLTLYHLFEEGVSLNPEAVAVRYYNETHTYEWLHRKVLSEISRLKLLGLKSNQPIAIYMDHSPELIIAILAASALGITYVPLDPSYPTQRTVYILRHAEIEHVFVLPGTRIEEFNTLQVHEVNADSNTFELEEDFRAEVSPEDLLYLIYTSGSTGNPKGVMVPNGGVANYLLWMKEAYSVTAADKVLAKTSISFDISVWELFLPLIAGGSVVLKNRGDMESPDQIANAIQKHQVSIAQFVPSGLKLFNDAEMLGHCPSLQHIFCGGEKMPTELSTDVLSHFTGKLHNLYGPTEASIFMSSMDCYRPTSYVNIPIGRPIYNARLFVLDDKLELAPIGVEGNLFIGGNILASGYWKDEEQTNKTFVKVKALGDQVIYRTGDRGRLLPNGMFEFCGRVDHQIKIRGYRVEPGEIEAQLLKFEGVKQALVFKNVMDEDDERLHAVLVTDLPVDVEEIKSGLRNQLPGYMIPAVISVVDEIPKLPNGKIDVKGLKQSRNSFSNPKPKAFAVVNGAQKSTEVESVIQKIWSEVLGHNEFSQSDNFFDAGGHSVLFLKIKDKIKEKLNVDFSIVDLYQYPNVKSIAEQYRKKYMDAASDSINAVRSRVELKKRNYGRSRRK